MCDLQLSSFVMARVLAFEINTINGFSSVPQSCPTLCDPMNRNTPGLPVHHQLPEFTQTHVHSVSDAIQPSHPLSTLLLPPIPPRIRVFSNESTLRMRLWGTKKPLDESERGEWKSWLKAQHSENDDHGIWSHHFMANRWGNSVRLYFWGLHNHCRWWLQPWN